MTWKQYAIGSLAGIILGASGVYTYSGGNPAKIKKQSDICARDSQFLNGRIAEYERQLEQCTNIRNLMALCYDVNPSIFFSMDYNRILVYLENCVVTKVVPDRSGNALQQLQYNESISE